MDTTPEALFDSAMKLPADQREDLAARLYSNLHDDLPLDPAWNEEIARRVSELDSGKVKLVPAEEVHWKMRERLGE